VQRWSSIFMRFTALIEFLSSRILISAKTFSKVAVLMETQSKLWYHQKPNIPRKIFVAKFWQIVFVDVFHQNKVKSNHQDHIRVSRGKAHETRNSAWLRMSWLFIHHTLVQSNLAFTIIPKNRMAWSNGIMYSI
jgi:hypothetical protein